MAKPTPVTAFKTSDGNLWDTEEKAAAHEQWLLVHKTFIGTYPAPMRTCHSTFQVVTKLFTLTPKDK